MKKLSVLLFAVCIFSLAASAQTERAAEVKTQDREMHHKDRHGKEKMMKELNLSKEQKAQLKAHHQEMKAKRDALKAQDNITVKEMREKQTALREEQKSKMDALLTPEQKTKMAELKKQRGEKRKHKISKEGDVKK